MCVSQKGFPLGFMEEKREKLFIWPHYHSAIFFCLPLSLPFPKLWSSRSLTLLSAFVSGFISCLSSAVFCFESGPFTTFTSLFTVNKPPLHLRGNMLENLYFQSERRRQAHDKWQFLTCTHWEKWKHKYKSTQQANKQPHRKIRPSIRNSHPDNHTEENRSTVCFYALFSSSFCSLTSFGSI